MNDQPRPRRRIWPWLLLVPLLLAGALFAAYELIASPFQAMALAGYGKRLTFQVKNGEALALLPAAQGPYDLRMGYAGLPAFMTRLKAQGFDVTHQARVSPEMNQVAEYGLFVPYREKSVGGLTLLDAEARPLQQSLYPRYTYPDFNAVPAVVANTLLFIENRELLDPNHPQRNPAVEWDRLGQAVLEKALQTIDPSRNVPGGSTLATQIEKYRHSPDGLTLTASDKLRQMASASLRAYLEGEDTRATRKRIVLDYLNTVPLAAAPGVGEVNGVGDALSAWFALDFATVNALLRNPMPSPEAARAYKHVLALLISQRKPSYYLLGGRNELESLANTHLRLLATAKVITPEFRDQALRERIVFKTGVNRRGVAGFIDRKAVNALRVELMGRLGVPRLYDMDRLDLTVNTTLHGPTQAAVSAFLRSLNTPEAVAAAGLYGKYLLAPEDALDKPIFSFTLYENTEEGALLRVQADNLNQPFDINQGAKLDMGSSAKLRTLITYLQLVTELHERYASLPRQELQEIPVAEKDLLLRWVIDYLLTTEERALSPMLRAAMGRRYAASPDEVFFTGGGAHTFANFHKEDNGKVMDLWEATRNSVNLPFIRLMRDIVRHFMYRDPDGAARILADGNDPRRGFYLRRFADQEGKSYLARFHKRYKNLSADETVAAMLNHLTANPKRLAAVYRYLDPHADVASFTRFLKARLGNPETFSEGDFLYLYETYGPEKFDLSDRGYIAQVHPLELWLVAYLRAHPGASWHEIVEASGKERVQVYDWLINTSHKNAQDIRIHSLLEIEAFQEVHKRWRALGYPFGSLVPSYATAIGSSADRPAALAELMGVITNGGVKLPPVTLTRLEFAANTPYHTTLKRRLPTGERIFAKEISALVREALANVVQEGTARRLRGTFLNDEGVPLTIGGKTGTGDHRFEVYAANGTMVESKVMNRTATFAFYFGSRFFGVMTAFVPGEAASEYDFTSALAVQIVKDMEPLLKPLVLTREGALPAPVQAESTVPAVQAERAAPPAVPVQKPLIPLTPATELTHAPAAGGQAAKATKAKSEPSVKPATPRLKVEPAVQSAPVLQEAAPAKEPPQAPPPPQIDRPDPQTRPPASPSPKPGNASGERQSPWSSPDGTELLLF